MKEIQDSEILDLFKADKTKNEAFNLLMRKYQQRIYWHVRRLVLNHEDADDIVQDVFVKVWKHLNNFRQDAQLYTWIYRIGTNESITFLNKKKQQQNVPLDDVLPQLSEYLTQDHYFNGDQAEKKLQEALLTLPEKQRLVFTMKYFDDLKYQEISDILETSVGALKASYHLAVKKIEDFLTKS